MHDKYVAILELFESFSEMFEFEAKAEYLMLYLWTVCIAIAYRWKYVYMNYIYVLLARSCQDSAGIIWISKYSK